ncbi:MAG: hypothetical protein M0018_07195 [Nitrospiraceae bacterium]|nr:hypothetical protein [Nitrospiraceae bacterium]
MDEKEEDQIEYLRVGGAGLRDLYAHALKRVYQSGAFNHDHCVLSKATDPETTSHEDLQIREAMFLLMRFSMAPNDYDKAVFQLDLDKE